MKREEEKRGFYNRGSKKFFIWIRPISQVALAILPAISSLVTSYLPSMQQPMSCFELAVFVVLYLGGAIFTVLFNTTQM
jgi:hypothetical protein